MTDRPAPGSAPAVGVRCSAGLWAEVEAQIHQSDHDEHGGALLCGVAHGHRKGVQLLASRFVPAIDGIDYVRGMKGHRALTPAFIRRVIRVAEPETLACLFVHGHGRGSSVSFSEIDYESHERGYPALLEISGQIIGALVLASHAVAGDVWIPNTGRAEVSNLTVIGHNIAMLDPAPVKVGARRPEDDRQARLFGDRGQYILRQTRVGVVGVGGAGMLAVEWLTRMGVGQIVVIDEDRVELTNLTRLPGATRFDAHSFLTAPNRPGWLRRLGQRCATPKVRVARRLARQAGQGTKVFDYRSDVRAKDAAMALTDCDFIVLAADTAPARHLVNIISHQYLVPAIQVGVRDPGG